MSLTINTSKYKSKIKIAGDLTIYDVGAYHEKLKERFRIDKNLEFDLSGVGEVDAAGLQLLAAYGKKAVEHGVKVDIVASNEDVDEALETSSLIGSLKCAED